MGNDSNSDRLKNFTAAADKKLQQTTTKQLPSCFRTYVKTSFVCIGLLDIGIICDAKGVAAIWLLKNVRIITILILCIILRHYYLIL